MRAFPKARVVTKQAGQGLARKDSVGAFRATGQPGKPYKVPWDLSRSMREGMQRVVWVYRAVNAIASNQAALPVVVRHGDKVTGEIDEQHVIAALMNSQPNPYAQPFGFRYTLSAHILLSRRGAFIEIVRDKGGRPVELYLLPPDRTAPIPDARKFVSGFEVDLGGSNKVTLAPENVLWIRAPHPGDPYGSMTPLESAGVSVEIDFLARLYNRTFLQNDGRPGGLVAIRGDLGDEAQEEIEERFDGGPANAGTTTVIEADWATYIDTSTTPHDAQFVEMRRLAKEDIIVAFGTPLTVMGDASNRTFDNAHAERLVFWQETMPPHCTLISDGLAPLDEDPAVFVGFDYDGVDVLAQMKREQRAGVLAEFQAGAASMNDFRRATGQAEIPQPWADQHWLPISSVPVGSNTGPAPAAPAPPATGKGLDGARRTRTGWQHRPVRA